MKKIFLPLLLISMTSVAHADFKFNSVFSCAVETKGKNTFWFCGGNQEQKCIGKTASGKRTRTWNKHGDHFEKDDRTFWCCDTDGDGVGNYVEGPEYDKTETVTVQLENGTCNYIIKKTICGEESGTPCTKPDNCSAGYVLRNDLCVEPCKSTYAFESASSNNCIECLTTEYQGISKENICIKCDPEIAFFDKLKQTCVNKRDMKQVSKNAMKNCFRCPDNITFKDCVTVLSATTAQNVANFNQLEILAKTSEQMKTYLDRMNSSLKSCHISKTAVLNGEEDIYEE